MKKLLVGVCTLMLSVSAMAQQTVESQITELKQKIEAQQQQLNGLSQRVSEVEQLNVDLRKAMNFGKAITTAQGGNGVTYKLISLGIKLKSLSRPFSKCPLQAIWWIWLLLGMKPPM